jgi:hypothetical protein
MRKQPCRTGRLPAAALTLLAISAPCFSRSAPPVATTARFEFHSDPWINLHHFLYQWAREDLGLVPGRPPVPERADLASLTAPQRVAWLDAVASYRKSFGTRWHLDQENLRLNRGLLNLGGNLAAEPPDTMPGIGPVLRAAMPLYRKLWWPRHDRANRAWIATLVPILSRHEAGFVRLTNRIYNATWPETRLRVDVSAYFNSRAGYTSIDGHIVMYSSDPASQNLYALEMLLHEVQHTRFVSDRIASFEALAPAFQAAGAKQPENLWHALLFATAGEYVRSVSLAERRPEHKPYWIEQGFEKREGWSDLVPLVQKYWLPVVRGESSTPDAIAALARAIRQSQLE